jgi:3-deoxy-D-manno-octulosonic acid kinase
MKRQPFEAHDVNGGELWATEAELPAMQALGLHLQNRWQDYLRAGLAGGRGRIAIVETRTRRLLLKQLRRGGALRGLWRDRFAGKRRLLANLTLPLEASDRGVSTPPVVAMLLVSGPPGFWRGWLAVELVEHARDLASQLIDGELTDERWELALRQVRKLHDAGIEHPDLNLGNLMTSQDGTAWIIDLDKAQRRSGSLGTSARCAGLRRLRRSYRKICLENGLEAKLTDEWLAWYGADEAIRQSFSSGS